MGSMLRKGFTSREVLEQGARGVCVLTHRATGKGILGTGSSVSKGTEALSSLQNQA